MVTKESLSQDALWKSCARWVEVAWMVCSARAPSSRAPEQNDCYCLRRIYEYYLDW